jgi:hypothetical protein
MTQLTGTTDSYRVGAAGGNREDLEDVIWELDPLDTYCLSNFPKVKADATFHEWEMDALVGVTANRQLEGDDATMVTVTAPTRAGNYCQISRKTFLISGTQEVVSKAGRKSEIKRQMKKQMKELKNDMEYAIVRNQGSSAGGSATAPTDGSTTGAFNETAFIAALELAWTDGGNPRSILMSAANKKLASAFAGVATKTHNVEGRSKPVIAGDVDVYVSAFGTHNFILHRHVRGNTVLCLDPEYWAVATLRAPFMEQLAKTGDGEKYQLLSEFTLVSRNHNASSKVANCTG